MFVLNILLIVCKRAVDCIWLVWRKRWRYLPSPTITDE